MIERTFEVARREFRSYFDHPTAYVLLVVFLAVNFFFYFQNLFTTGLATARPMFRLFPWLYLFFIPAVAMGTLAEERKTGSLELTLAQPIREGEFLVGKYLGVMALVAVALASTLGVPLGLSVAADLRAGSVFAQYVGAFLLASGFAAIGIWASSMTRNQITAFILGVAVCFVFVGMNLDVVRMGLPSFLATATTRLGAQAHYENVIRGVIDLRDVIYFLTLTAGFLVLAYWSLMRDKLSSEGSAYRTLRLGTAGLLGIFVMVNLLGRDIRGRWDLTPGNVYSISEGTREILRGLNDVVTATLVVSDELPAQIAHVRRDVSDLLADYRSIAGDDFRVERLDPGDSESARREARRLGIPAVQFNVVGQGQLQVKEGYLGLAIQFADETKRLPVIRRAADLEYRVTSSILELTRESKPTLGLLQGGARPRPGQGGNLARARKILRESYSVQSVSPPPDSAAGDADIPPDLRALVVPHGERLSRASAGAVRSYLNGDGNVLFLVEGMRRSRRPRGGGMQSAMPAPPSSLDSLLQDFGVQVVPGYAFDLRSNASVRMGGRGALPVARPYPLWLMARPASSSRIVRGLTSVLLPWVSPLEVSADTAVASSLLQSTRFAGRLTGRTSLRPDQDWRSLADSLRTQTVAVAVRPGGSASGTSGSSSGRFIVVGDGDFLTDRFLRSGSDNRTFLQNAVDWLAQREALIDIRSGSRTPPPLVFSSSTTRGLMKYGNLVGVPLLLIGVGGWRLLERRRKQRRSYPDERTPGDPEEVEG